jgi:hypothetical protein
MFKLVSKWIEKEVKWKNIDLFDDNNQEFSGSEIEKNTKIWLRDLDTEMSIETGALKIKLPVMIPWPLQSLFV